VNGRDRSDENVATFQAWVVAKTRSELRELANGDRLNRGEIARECGFSRSVLRQNPRVRQALADLEDQLREEGVIAAVEQTGGIPIRKRGQIQAATDAERLKKLEAENVALKAEVAALRNRVKLSDILNRMLSETGRLPR
jgi:hypothetical protein